MDMNFSHELAQSTTAVQRGGDHGSYENAAADTAISYTSTLDPIEPLSSACNRYQSYT